VILSPLVSSTESSCQPRASIRSFVNRVQLTAEATRAEATDTQSLQTHKSVLSCLVQECLVAADTQECLVHLTAPANNTHKTNNTHKRARTHTHTSTRTWGERKRERPERACRMRRSKASNRDSLSRRRTHVKRLSICTPHTLRV
jgi:hypothetical protein